MEDSSYYSGLNKKLLEQIPKNATKILELGCAEGKLGSAFKKNSEYPVLWTGVDICDEAISKAQLTLDRVVKLDLNSHSILSSFSNENFDAVVIGDLLEHMIDPAQLLVDLVAVCRSDATLVMCLPNSTHLSIFASMLYGDLSYEDAGLLDRTYLRLFSASSAAKTLLDAGWLPSVVDEYKTDLPVGDLLKGLASSAATLGVSTEYFVEQLSTYQLIFSAKLRKKNGTSCKYKGKNIPSKTVDCIVPVNNEWQFNKNTLASPGIKELNGNVIPITAAKDAGAAFQLGLNNAASEWVLFCHQDVYFPAGFGGQLLSAIEELNSKGAELAGFVGLNLEELQYKIRGCVVDRRKLIAEGAGSCALSLDECAILIRKDSQLKIDSSLGWHVWASDLCLQAYFNPDIRPAEILDIPIFHNSLTSHELPNNYSASIQVMFNKYPKLSNLELLCGSFSRLNYERGTGPS